MGKNRAKALKTMVQKMGKSKRKNYQPSSLRELEPDMQIIPSTTFRDILWKEGDLVSVVEDDEEYYAQVFN